MKTISDVNKAAASYARSAGFKASGRLWTSMANARKHALAQGQDLDYVLVRMEAKVDQRIARDAARGAALALSQGAVSAPVREEALAMLSEVNSAASARRDFLTAVL